MKRSTLVSLLALFLIATGCATAPRAPRTPLQWYPYSKTGTASWYGGKFHGRKTANGERYNKYALTCAHRKLPFGARVEVTHLGNGKSVVLRVNDRGPYAGGRLIDVSRKAAQKLGLLQQGVAKVRVKWLKPGGATKPAPQPAESTESKEVGNEADAIGEMITGGDTPEPTMYSP